MAGGQIRRGLTPEELQQIANVATASQVELVRQDAEVVMNLSDITANGTNLIAVGTNPSAGQTSLTRGTITRVSNKAYCTLEMRTDDQSTVEIILGSSIVPQGGAILSMTDVSTAIDTQNIDTRIDTANQFSFDIAGTRSDRTLRFGFWVSGYPAFVEYSLRGIS